MRATPSDTGRIVIATQAIEAGVDVSATMLFTELAPWPSLVQRFGRCNRRGEDSNASVVWIDVQPKDEKDKVLQPYSKQELDQSRGYLTQLTNVGPTALEATSREFEATCEPPIVHTLRRKDLFDLWDTTPDLAGNDLDVSRFIRDSDDTDVQFYWRDFDGDFPGDDLTAPVREELCSVRIGSAREFLVKIKKAKSFQAFLWNPLDGTWSRIDSEECRPGMVLLLKREMGGYLDNIGWTGDPAHKPTVRPDLSKDQSNSEMNSDPMSETTRWVSLADHSKHVADAIASLQLHHAGWDSAIPWPELLTAAWWHDVGKSHPAFQNMLLKDRLDSEQRRDTLWSKSGHDATHPKRIGHPSYFVVAPHGIEQRVGFRHELASALAWLNHHADDENANLIAYLIAAHHGKVRVSIRSLPNESAPPNPETKFARGIWDGDQLPEVTLSSDKKVPATTLDLALMQLGHGQQGPSWLSRVLELRNNTDHYGPFRLAFLEALIRVADWRGTQVGELSHDA